MKPACKTALPLIEAYLDDELSEGKRRQVEAHLADCDGCQQHLTTLQRRGEILRAHFDEVVQAAEFGDFDDQVMRKLALEPPLPWTESLSLWLRETLAQYRLVWITALATTAIVLAVLIPMLGQRAPQTQTMPTPEPKHATVDTQHAQVAQVGRQVDNDVIIDSMEYGGDRSMIYTISRNNTTVIWLVDFDSNAATDGQGDEL